MANQGTISDEGDAGVQYTSPIVTLSNKFRELAVTFGIPTYKMGYIQDIDTGVTNFDALVLSPPDAVISTPHAWSTREWNIMYHLMRLDKNASGDPMTDLEIEQTWGSLDTLNRSIINDIQSTPSAFQISSEIKIRHDIGAVDRVIWLEVSFKLKVVDCGE